MRVPEYKNVTFLVRPQRVVTFISKDDRYWKHTAMRLIERYSEVWGGAYNLIIPTDGNTIKEEFWAILERYDPDYLYQYRYTLSDLEYADPDKYKEIADRRESQLGEQFPDLSRAFKEEFVRRHDLHIRTADFWISNSLQEELKRRLSHFLFLGRVVEPSFSANSFPFTQIENIIKYTDEKEIACPNLEDYSHDPSVMLLFYSHVGKAAEEYLGNLGDCGVEHQQVTCEYDLWKYLLDDPMGNRELLSTPFSFSMVHLGRYHKIKERPEREGPVALVLGDTVEDFCFFYCLSRMNGDSYWLPLSFLKNHTEAKKEGADKYISFFHPEGVGPSIMTHLYDKYGSSQRDIVLTSISLSIEELEERTRELPEPLMSYGAKTLGAVKVSRDFCSFLRFSQRVCERDSYLNQQTLAFLNSESISRLETPKPKNFRFIDPANHRWITDAMIDGYHLPQLRSLGSEATSLPENGVRVSSEGLSYLCPNCLGSFGRSIDAELAKPRLKLVDPLEIFRDYFREAGYSHVELSDKGRYARETIEKFGSLDEVGRFFSEKRNLDLFGKFLSKQSTYSKKNGEVVSVKDRAYLDFQAVGSALENRDEAISLIDKLVSQEILHRGFIFQCKRCSNCDWYGMEEVTDSFICKRCRTQRQYRHENWKSPEEPKWYYQLDEVVFQGYRNNMHVPILTLYKLKSGSESFLYVHELELRLDESQEKPEMEIDVCCIPDGQIVIGESKAPRIPLRDIDKYSCLAAKLPRYPDKVVFATLEQNLSPDIGDRISNVRNSVLLLRGDLMSD